MGRESRIPLNQESSLLDHRDFVLERLSAPDRSQRVKSFVNIFGPSSK